MTDIRSMTIEELELFVTGMGEKKFRAKQLYEWMHKRLCSDFDQMSNLPKGFRDFLIRECSLGAVREVTRQISEIDGTRKYLFSLEDGNVIESVWMQYHHGNSVCISSQVGCNMGCRFCASTIGGCKRSLSPSEMLGQVYEIQRSTGQRVSNVVIMGSGEPLENYDNVLKFLRLINDPEGLCISHRNITLSTCGIVPRIYELADEELAITLAISLHAATDEKRQSIMPIARKYSLQELLEACRYYEKKCSRRLTFEYSLVAGVNDSMEDARQLAFLLEGLSAHVNLIPVNPVRERSFKRPDRQGLLAFQNKLEKMKINVTIRREMGRDIDGACGQLRRRHIGDSLAPVE